MKTVVILVMLLGLSLPCVDADENETPVSYFKVLETFRSRADLFGNLDAQTMEEVFETIGEVAGALNVHDLVETLAHSRNEGQRAKVRHNLQVASSILEAANAPSAACLNDTNEVIQGLLNTEMWAIQMLDAAGKPDAGILRVQIRWLGSYEECLNVSVALQPSNRSSLSQKPFRTKFCGGLLPLSLFGGALKLPVVLGVCVPESCSGQDVDAVLSSLLHDIPGNATKALNFAGSVCLERELPLSGPAIAAIVVAAIFIALMVAGTLYDVIAIQRPRWAWQQQQSDAMSDVIFRGGASTNSDATDERRPLLEGKKMSDVEELNLQPGVCGRLLASFSVYTNGSKLLHTSQREGSLAAVNGVRFLSMSWVILGHTFAFGVYTLQNIIDVADYFKRWTFTAIANATVSVDSFFTLSGLLMTYLVLKELKRNDGKLNWFMFFFHRFWRLTPPYMLLMLLYVPLFPYLGSGPQWPQKGLEVTNCTYWWRNLLYINNFFPSNEMCMGWSWYLANDMQFYILSPLIFLPLFYSKVAGAVSVLVFLLATTITPGVISVTHGFTGGLAEQQQGGNETESSFDEIYIRPYCRMGPYIVGMVTGYILYRTDCKVRLPVWASVLGWAVAWATGLAVVYGMYGELSGTHPNSPSVDAFYNAVNRTVWGMCVSWVVFACVTGHGGFVNTLLSWKAFVPLARLTYLAYLVHPILIFAYFLSGDVPFYLNDVNIVVAFLGLLVASYGVAFLLSLALEAPMMALEKVLLNRGKSS